jgi:hypothetical protein
MNLKRNLVVALVLGIAGAGLILAQRAASPGERWDEDEVVTLEGTVTKIERPIASFDAHGKVYTVHLGPSWFWRRHGYTLSRGDQVTITGEVSVEGETSHLYLHALERADTAYRFADDDGVPLWAGGRGRGRGWGGQHVRCCQGPHAHSACGQGPGCWW